MIIMTDGFPDCPETFPDHQFTKVHRRRAELNHSQTLERLNKRGGVSMSELVAILSDKDFVSKKRTFQSEYYNMSFIRGYLGLRVPRPRNDPVFVAWRQQHPHIPEG